MSRTLVRSAVRGGVVAVAMMAPALAASPAVSSNDAPAKKRLVADQSGVRFRLGPFALGRDWIEMTVIIENRRDEGVQLAAVSDPDAHDALQVKLTDDSGTVCAASAHPAGIDTIPPPGPTPAAPTNSMTPLAPHAQTNIALRFAKCRLSRTSPLSLSGEFGLAAADQPTQLITVRFAGIEQRTTTW